MVIGLDRVFKGFLIHCPNENWIVDVFAHEYAEHFDMLFPSFEKYIGIGGEHRLRSSDIIWIIADWCADQLYQWENILKNSEKFIVTTCHHFVEKKININDRIKYAFLDRVTTIFHVPCEHTKTQLISIFGIKSEKIVVCPFWINKSVYFPIVDKQKLRDKHNLPKDKFLVFSAVRDTEGVSIANRQFLPKLEKGVHYLPKILSDLKTDHDLEVVLAGWRRDYIRQELDKLSINYHRFDVDDVTKIIKAKIINELYNACDLVINPAEVEGGPASIWESAATKTPIISTNTGVATVMLHEKSIYSNETGNWREALQNALSDDIIEYNFNSVSKYFVSLDNINEKGGFIFFDKLFDFQMGNLEKNKIIL